MMAHKLGEEIGKTGPFASLEEEVVLNFLRTADRLLGSLEGALRPMGLSPTQYNVLRILRGVSPQGLACQEIARRMITRDSDLTRLVDRLKARGLVDRQRQTKDRRVVLVTITPAGLAKLAELDGPVLGFNKTLLGHIHPERLQLLLELVEEVRHRADQ
jgi:DNA-binding MarR family transcriptional regulator